MIGGVAGAVARRHHISTNLVRIGFVIAGLASGVGIIAYAIGWLLIPSESADEPIGKRALNDPRGIAMAIGLLPLIFIGALVSAVFKGTIVSNLAFPALASPAVLFLIWRHGDEADRAKFTAAAEPFRQLGQPREDGRLRGFLARVLVAAALLVGGLLVLVHLGSVNKRSYEEALAGTFLVVVGLVVLFGPWWLRLARDLVFERQARARAEERADMAARVHDSVLQTLAMIQRRADQPSQVVSLARAQERELRSWLFEGDAGPGELQDTTFAAAVKRIQGEVEALHELPVDAVVVGDCLLDDGLRSMLAAAKEALVNAAKWSGSPTLSLFGEIDGDRVWVFVRDRGVGFVEQDVAEDRRGIAESIRGRMGRHGGTATIRSVVGEGTEVALSMPLAPSSQRTPQA
jgi:signal transduction histidine kinase/phage shock protein PspC (stress-responsive transcriptional regulator)